MAYAQIDIENLSIRHVGVSKEIHSLTENSAEANACNRFFQIATDTVTRDMVWPFATIAAPLALVASYVPPNPPASVTQVPEWWFAYAYPADCMRVHYLLLNLPAAATPRVPWRPPYVIRNNPDAGGQLIFTNQPNAVVEYTQIQGPDMVNNWPSDFVDLVALKLAWYIVPSLAAGDPFKLGDRIAALYATRMEQTAANALNEQQALPLPESSFVDTRMVGGSPWDWGGWPIGPFPG